MHQDKEPEELGVSRRKGLGLTGRVYDLVSLWEGVSQEIWNAFPDELSLDKPVTMPRGARPVKSTSDLG